MNQGWTYREQIGFQEAGLTVLQYYTQKYHHSTNKEWLERIRLGQICLDNCPVMPQTRLERGQWLIYHRLPWQEPDVPLAFDTLYEDEHLLIVNKPSGLPVLPGGGFLEHTLLWQLKKQYPQDKPIPIHRLGRGTSGLMLIGRSAMARSHLTQQMRNRQIRKVYRTLIGKSDLPAQFIIEYPIGKIPYPRLGYLYAATPDGKWSYSEGRVLKRSEKSTLLEVTILTGRPHQIRIHLAKKGYPLLGEPLYTMGGIPKQDDSSVTPGDVGYFLHAYQLSFVHPTTQELMNFICPEPEDYQFDFKF